jgi:hypothetical protein
LVDRAGRSLAVDPPHAAGAEFADPLSVLPLGDGTGVFRVSNDGAADRFTTVKSLSATAGRVAFASLVNSHLAAWRRAATVTVLLLASACDDGRVLSSGRGLLRSRCPQQTQAPARGLRCSDAPQSRAKPGTLRTLDLGPECRPHCLVNVDVRRSRSRRAV